MAYFERRRKYQFVFCIEFNDKMICIPLWDNLSQKIVHNLDIK